MPKLRHEVIFRDDIRRALEAADEANRAGLALSAEYRAGFQHALVTIDKAFDVGFAPLPAPRGAVRMILPDKR